MSVVDARALLTHTECGEVVVVHSDVPQPAPPPPDLAEGDEVPHHTHEGPKGEGANSDALLHESTNEKQKRFSKL